MNHKRATSRYRWELPIPIKLRLIKRRRAKLTVAQNHMVSRMWATRTLAGLRIE